jgi:hypothetical protein
LRNLAVGFIAGALLLVALPVVADHVNEPTHPLVQLDLWVGHDSTGERLDCSTFDTFDKTVLGVNGGVVSNGPTGDPSEHFDVLLTVWNSWDPARNQGTMLFSDKWRHQNIPPHPPDGWQADKTDIRVGDMPGSWKVELEVKGRESGVVLIEDCVFEVVSP